MKTKTGVSAFPMPMTMMTSEHIANEPESGMTLRDYFAAKAMNGFIGHVDYRTIPADLIARDAYEIADAMLKAREQ